LLILKQFLQILKFTPIICSNILQILKSTLTIYSSKHFNIEDFLGNIH